MCNTQLWLLDVNVVSFVIWPSILEIPWLHPFVFGGSAASVGKDVGMLMGSGIVTQMLHASGNVLQSAIESVGKKTRGSSDKSKSDLQAPSKYEVNASSMEED
jgi:hypothetical protein